MQTHRTTISNLDPVILLFAGSGKTGRSAFDRPVAKGFAARAVSRSTQRPAPIRCVNHAPLKPEKTRVRS